METRLFFELPDDAESIIRLIWSVPVHWFSAYAHFEPPKELAALGLVAEGTGYDISYGSHDTNIRVLGVVSLGETAPPKDIDGLVFERKYPAFVRCHGYILPVSQSASRLIRNGYRGQISFELWRDRREYRDDLASISFRLQSFNGWDHDHVEPGPQPARLKIEWNERNGGSSTSAESVIIACKEIGLKQYVPQTAEKMASV